MGGAEFNAYSAFKNYESTVLDRGDQMASFSGALKLSDLDDFITPSQVRWAVSLYAHEILNTLYAM